MELIRGSDIRLGVFSLAAVLCQWNRAGKKTFGGFNGIVLRQTNKQTGMTTTSVCDLCGIHVSGVGLVIFINVFVPTRERV